ncbi:uncharacterized protein LOC112575403 [Pomacea canaliculata]|uniref:uncharacterized protein LOC112575403 n=1 Tax=Pomacea canaliculata TaxID=400727 RepID=UPI000D72D765|nr:uncharacterized protein LOC112575403 [Pomacea canaliculata]
MVSSLTEFYIWLVKFLVLLQDLRKCLGAADPADIPGLCLCSDQLSDPKTPWDVSSHVLIELRNWWQRRVAGAGPDSQMTDYLYWILVSRFCGPATTVIVPCTVPSRLSIKTLGQAVSFTGECYTSVITLFPEQVQLLNTAPSRLFVAGPPGTGKSVVLLLMGIEWLRWLHDVYIVSTGMWSRAACSMLYNMLLSTMLLKMTTKVSPNQLHYLQYDFTQSTDVEKAIRDLSQTASGRPLYIIADEAGPEDKFDTFQGFCGELLEIVPHLHLWAASCYHKVAPAGWQEEYLTRPLRSPPVVVREVEQDIVMALDRDVQAYSERGVPDHTDGPPVKHIIHHGHGRSPYWPVNCVNCGREVARFLLSLQMGASTNSTTFASGGMAPPCLQWRDVLVLYWGDISDRLGMMTGLKEAGIPVRLMKDDDIEDVATARSDVVWIAKGQHVRGLERKVIVYVEPDLRHAVVDIRAVRLHFLSRCTSQLVIVSAEVTSSSNTSICF